MKAAFRSLILLMLVILYGCGAALGQDSTIVYQEKASLFSNKYIFFSNHTFKHFFYTDDGQVWYGTGSFKDQNKKRILYFADADTTFKTTLYIHYESNFSRTLKIREDKFRSGDFYYTTRKKTVIFAQRK